MNSPLLGLATTGEMIDELLARFEISGNHRAWYDQSLVKTFLTEDEQQYRTVDHLESKEPHQWFAECSACGWREERDSEDEAHLAAREHGNHCRKAIDGRKG